MLALSNRVLIKVNVHKFSGGVSLNDNISRNIDVFGEVVSVGKSKFLKKKIDGLWGSMMCKDHVSRWANWSRKHQYFDCKVGDLAIFSYTYALEERNWIEHKGQQYLLLPKEAVFGVKREGELIPTNGYSFLRMESSKEYEGLISLHKEYDVDYTVGRITHVSKRSMGSIGEEGFDGKVKPGVIVKFKKHFSLRLQVEEHSDFPIFAIPTKDISAYVI